MPKRGKVLHKEDRKNSVGRPAFRNTGSDYTNYLVLVLSVLSDRKLSLGVPSLPESFP